MLWKVQQNRHFAIEASLEAGVEAMEMAIYAMESGARQTFLLGWSKPRGCGKRSRGETWLGWGKPRGRPRGYGNCQWCYGKWSKTGKPRGRPRGYGKCSKGETWLGWGRPRGRPRGYGNCSKGETWLGWSKPRGRPRGRPRGYGNGDWWYGKWSKTGIWVARMRQASRQASRLWKLQRGKGETWLRWGKTRGRPPHLDIHTISHAGAKSLLHVSIRACHPCAGAMLIFSVSFQFYRMIPEGNPLGSESKRCLPSPATHPDMQSLMSKKLVTFLDLCVCVCVSSLRRGHANLLCIVPILSNDPRRESTGQGVKKVLTLHPSIQTCSHSRAKNLLLFSICACHPCAGAMLIFSVSFQFYRMISKGNPLGSEQKRCWPCSLPRSTSGTDGPWLLISPCLLSFVLNI